MSNVITGIKVQENRNIPKFVHDSIGPALEYKFTVNFKQASEILGKSKEIRVAVRQQGNGPKSKIEITIIKPDKTKAFDGVLFAINKPPPLERTENLDGIKILDPGADNVTRFKYQIKDNDPDGVWIIQIKNKGVQAEIFNVKITHPDMQLTLIESRIPFSLLNRLLTKVNMLMALKIRIDKDLTLDFSEKFKDAIGLEKMRFHIGTKTVKKGIPEPLTGINLISKDFNYSLKDINLNKINLKIIPQDNDAIALSIHLVFEHEGSEIVTFLGDIDITKLEVKADIAFKGAFIPFYVEERNLAGKFIESHFPESRLKPTFEPTIEVDKFLGFISMSGINSAAERAFEDLLKSNDTKNVLKIIAEHFTDMLLFLASGKDNQVLFDLQTSSTDIIVRHHEIPSNSLRRRQALPFNIDHEAGVFATPEAPDAPDAVVGAFQTFKVKFFNFLSFKPPLMQPLKPQVIAPLHENHRKIEHIVVMMLENRSFDHMLGYLTIKKNRLDVDGLGAPGNHTNPVPGSTINEKVFRLTDGAKIEIDPGHSVNDVKEQIADGNMSGFVSNYMKKKDIKARPGDEKLVMGFYDNETLDVFDFLADEYLVCDRWFSSHPGATYPNRFISVMGSAPDINNFKIGGNEAGAVKGDTIFDILSKEKVSWKYVESNIAFLRMFDKYRVDEKNIIQRDEWLEMAKNGQLPAVSWIDPHIVDLEIEGEADDDHPPANVKKGQQGVKEVYEALTENAAQWNKTLFIITYDEHGGFYDHVPPHGLNGETKPKVHKIHEEGEDFFGLRVPAIIVSPWVKKKSSSSTVFDHTSILKTILSNFIGTEATKKELLGKRTDAANSLLTLLEERPLAKAGKMKVSTTLFKAKLGTSPINNRKIENDSFHDGMLLFGLGPKLRRIISDRIKN